MPNILTRVLMKIANRHRPAEEGLGSFVDAELDQRQESLALLEARLDLIRNRRRTDG